MVVKVGVEKCPYCVEIRGDWSLKRFTKCFFKERVEGRDWSEV